MMVMMKRNIAVRLSVGLNICVLLYVCVHYGSSGPWSDDNVTNWDNGVQAPLVQNTQNDDIIIFPANSSIKITDYNKSTKETGSIEKDIVKEKIDEKIVEKIEEKITSNVDNENIKNVESKNVQAESGPGGQESPPLIQSSISLQDAIGCKDKNLDPRISQRGDYWVFYNYIPMTVSVKCWESITYTTHADFTFLDNLEPLIERWKAPVSIAMYTPGTDIQPTIESIKYLRNCASPLIAQLVTFHLYFSTKHVPKSIPSRDKIISGEVYNCSTGAPWLNSLYTTKMYKNEKKLLYPVNVGRNIARETAVTHYVLASDIELYPSPDLPSKFLEMIRQRDQPELLKPNPKVFVLPIFEVDEKSKPPQNKTLLLKMLKNGTAIPFHKKVCPGCHNVPKSKEWLEDKITNGLHIFGVGKRTGIFIHWEPIYIGTNTDPMYDERLSWEGKSDKMTQGYALCVLDYDFLILDNAFLVHRPGIKIYKRDSKRDALAAKTNVLIKKIIMPELKVIYGTKKGCVV